MDYIYIIIFIFIFKNIFFILFFILIKNILKSGFMDANNFDKEDIKKQSVIKRIEKDIEFFYESIARLNGIENKKMLKIIELSKMYTSDAKSYLEKGDLYTSFSCISYAHGLLDAIHIMNKDD